MISGFRLEMRASSRHQGCFAATVLGSVVAACIREMLRGDFDALFLAHERPRSCYYVCAQ